MSDLPAAVRAWLWRAGVLLAVWTALVLIYFGSIAVLLQGVHR